MGCEAVAEDGGLSLLDTCLLRIIVSDLMS
jgi:hypothetical protein